MGSFAWSTVSVVLLLLPGFLFFFGRQLTERFSRPEVQQGPVAQLVTALLVAFGVHLFLLLVVHWTCPSFGTRCVDYPLILGRHVPDAVSLQDQVGSSLWWVGWYSSAAIGLGIGAGWLWGWLLVVTGRGRRLAQHPWVVDLDSRRLPKKHRKYDHAYTAYVLSKMGQNEARVLYHGEISDIGIASSGCINYLTLVKPERRLFPFDPQKIDDDEAWHRVGSSEEKGDGAAGRGPQQILYVSGEAIENVVFGRYPLPPIKDAFPDHLVKIMQAALVESRRIVEKAID